MEGGKRERDSETDRHTKRGRQKGTETFSKRELERQMRVLDSDLGDRDRREGERYTQRLRDRETEAGPTNTRVDSREAQRRGWPPERGPWDLRVYRRVDARVSTPLVLKNPLLTFTLFIISS